MIDTVTKVATLQEHQQALLVILAEFDRVCKALDIPYVLFAGSMLGAVRHQGFIPWDDDLDVLLFREDYDRLLREGNTILDQELFFLQKEYSEHWPVFFSKLRMNNTACIEKYHPKDTQRHQGVYIDIFPCDNAMNSKVGRRLQFLASKVVIAKCLDKRSYDTDSKIKRLFMKLCRLLPMKPFLRLVQYKGHKGEWVHSFLGGARSFSRNVFPRRCFEERIDGSFEGKTYPISAQFDELLKILYDDYMVLPSEEQRAVKKHAILVDLEHSYEYYEHYRDGMEFEILTRSIR